MPPPLFRPPLAPAATGKHHADAAAGNFAATNAAIKELNRTLNGSADTERILLKAAAGAGKSYALKRMVAESLKNPNCRRVVVTAFTNKQIQPLAADLGPIVGKGYVCLFVSKDMLPEIPDSICDVATVVSDYKEVPEHTKVIIATSHKLGGSMRWLKNVLPPAANGEKLFDVMFVDEAWQLALHRYREVERAAPISVGVGDVGQLPPLDPGQNPWRGDRGYNPYRAWPTAYDNDPRTWSIELPAVWRPTQPQLGLWRAFYGDWDNLDCVAGPGDRSITFGGKLGASREIWHAVGSGVPCLVEVDGLPPADAPAIDPPLLHTVETWLDDLLGSKLQLHGHRYDDEGNPMSTTTTSFDTEGTDPLVAVLATRNQAVDDAQDMVGRLLERHQLPEGSVVASTVDSWQGQTNAITVAIHPLSGASALDEFNSAFGRLAVTCTRATHGLLLVSRTGLNELLGTAPPRPGTPLGEPGTRQLPRQTHERILATFARGLVSAQ